MDTGCAAVPAPHRYADHPDFASSHLSGYNGTEAITLWDEDTRGHGTHIAGIIAAPNNKEGIVGVALPAGASKVTQSSPMVEAYLEINAGCERLGRLELVLSDDSSEQTQQIQMQPIRSKKSKFAGEVSLPSGGGSRQSYGTIPRRLRTAKVFAWTSFRTTTRPNEPSACIDVNSCIPQPSNAPGTRPSGLLSLFFAL